METLSELIDLIFGKGRKEAERVYMHGMKWFWALYFTVLLGGTGFAYFNLRGGVWFLFFLCFVAFTTAVLRPSVLLAVVGISYVLGIPAEGSGAEMAQRAAKAYAKGVALALIWGMVYLMVLTMFPFLAGTFEAIFIDTMSVTMIAMVMTYGVVTGKITEGRWYWYVIWTSVVFLLYGFYAAIPKEYLVKYGIAPTIAQKQAAAVEDDDSKLRDARQVEKLAIFMSALECKASKERLAALSATNLATYNAACSAAGSKLTLEEMKQVFPAEYKIWNDTQTKAYLNEKRTPSDIEKAQSEIALGNLKRHEAKALECLTLYKEVVEGYIDADGRSIAPRVLTKDEEEGKAACTNRLQEVQNDIRKMHLEGSQGLSGAEKLTVIHFDLLDPSTWWESIVKFGVLHAVGIVVIGLIAWLFFKKKAGTEKTVTVKATASSSTDSKGWKNLMILLLLGVLGYAAYSMGAVDKATNWMIAKDRAKIAKEVPVWNHFLTREYVNEHGTRAWIDNIPLELSFDLDGNLVMSANGMEVYKMYQSTPCSVPAAYKEVDDQLLSVCQGALWGNGKRGTYEARFNPKILHGAYFHLPGETTKEVWFR